jgi:hypothetical protein
MRFDLTTFTFLHVALSLVGIIAGLVAVGGLVAGRRLDGWTGTFLATTFLTNLTGFGFPFVKFLPSHGVGIVSVVLLPAVAYALYLKRLEGTWRRVYVAGAVTALIVLAPKQQEPPFLLAQLLTLALFIGLGRAAWRGFAHEPAASLNPRTDRGVAPRPA